ncbi:hypothetical protein FHS82_001056 [Pseudochelatococcus lubricantis]|uniref:Uncharacterized protein n=1 Tax=Pseudochelatococcus lubricantis TaxID=1538102 RepID=A0ABX0UZ55_9HYPH|nr:hypothetical protein [Pseudochelatococcus lubricantis]NIJ57230.1 hypothetical protein [Pseudochelatococcus lubricantis]
MAEGFSGDDAKIYIGGQGDLATESNWQEVGGIEEIGEFGITYASNSYQTKGDKNTAVVKGAKEATTLDLTLIRDTLDPGQADLQDALDDSCDYNFKIELNDVNCAGGSGATGGNIKFKAKVMSYTVNPADILRSSTSLGINTKYWIETPRTNGAT